MIELEGVVAVAVAVVPRELVPQRIGGGFDRTVCAGCALRFPPGDGTELKALCA